MEPAPIQVAVPVAIPDAAQFRLQVIECLAVTRRLALSPIGIVSKLMEQLSRFAAAEGSHDVEAAGEAAHGFAGWQFDAGERIFSCGRSDPAKDQFSHHIPIRRETLAQETEAECRVDGGQERRWPAGETRRRHAAVNRRWAVLGQLGLELEKERIISQSGGIDWRADNLLERAQVILRRQIVGETNQEARQGVDTLPYLP